MNEVHRLAAWLVANAKHLKCREEQQEMLRAARMLRIMDREIEKNLDALQEAHTLLKEARDFANELSKQETLGSRPLLTVPSLWR